MKMINVIFFRIGRTGRVGNDGRAFSFIDWMDDGKIQVKYQTQTKQLDGDHNHNCQK